MLPQPSSPQLGLANSTSSSLLQKDGFVIKSFLSVRQLVVHTASQLGWKERGRGRTGGGEREAWPAHWQRILSKGKSFTDEFLLHWQAAALLNNSPRSWIVWADATIIQINGINETMPGSLLIQSEMLRSATEEEPSDHAASVCQLPFSQRAPDAVWNEYAKVHPTLLSHVQFLWKRKCIFNQHFKKQHQLPNHTLAKAC